MLSHADLTELYRTLQGEKVLSIYLDADQKDPAARKAWRTVLEQEIGQAGRELNGGDKEAFEAAWKHVADAVHDAENGFLEGRGLVAFATSDGVKYLEHLPISTRTLVRWEDGIRAAPYVRALKQQRPVLIALVDRMRMRRFTYRNAEIVEEESVITDKDLGDLSDIGMAKRGARHSGIRGETSTDEAQRILDENAERMLKSVAKELEEAAAGSDAFIVVGGTVETVGRLYDFLPERLQRRARKDTSLHVEMSANDLKNAVRELASDLTESEQETLVSEVLDAARSGGRGSAGREETEKALREMRVDTLLLSRSFLWDHPDFADHCVGTAFSQGATVLEVGGDSGDRLTQETGGIAARLRYR